MEVKIKTRSLPLSRNLHATTPVIRGANNDVFALVVGGQSCSKSDVFDDVFKITLDQAGTFYTGTNYQYAKYLMMLINSCRHNEHVWLHRKARRCYGRGHEKLGRHSMAKDLR